jgi:hypothetical protein
MNCGRELMEEEALLVIACCLEENHDNFIRVASHSFQNSAAFETT